MIHLVEDLVKALQDLPQDAWIYINDYKIEDIKVFDTNGFDSSHTLFNRTIDAVSLNNKHYKDTPLDL